MEIKLTEKQKRFADYYIETGNATQSYIDAGYKASKREVAEANARKLLANYSVKSYLDEIIKSKDNSRIASQNEVLEYYTRVMRGESISEVVVVEGIGEGMSKARRIDKKPDEKERIAAAKELAKRFGIDKPEESNTMEGVKVEW